MPCSCGHQMCHLLYHCITVPVQWLGNLVTPAWWSEVWLKEGFAAYFETLGATAANANLAVLDTFYGDATSKVPSLQMPRTIPITLLSAGKVS